MEYKNIKELPVSVKSADNYDVDSLCKIIREQFEHIGLSKSDFEGKKVAIKPNLIIKKSPEYAATTRPEILEAVIRIISTYNCKDIVIAESAGGPYTEESLRATYSVCKIKEVAEKCGVKLNYDTSYTEINSKDARLVKKFNVLTPIDEAEVIVNLPKIKTHALTGMSGSVKNYFGVIPGLQKFEMHARFPDYSEFASMLNDLAYTLASEKLTVNILDAIVGMEGNGPTGGSPRQIGCLLTSLNPFNIDRVAKEIIGVKEVLYVEESIKRGYTFASADDVSVIGDDYKKFCITDYKMPDSKPRGLALMLRKCSGGKLGQFFSPRPVISNRCVGCGECERSCPKHTIDMVEHKGKKIASIKLDNCIRCFCCQELCPLRAIDIKNNSLVSFVNRTKKK